MVTNTLFNRIEILEAQLTAETKRRKAAEAYAIKQRKWTDEVGDHALDRLFVNWQALIPAEEKEPT